MEMSACEKPPHTSSGLWAAIESKTGLSFLRLFAACASQSGLL